MADSIVTAFIAIFSLIAGFLLNVFYENYKERRKTRKESLRIHFDDIRTRIISKLSEMSRNLAIENNRLVFLLFYSGESVMEHYTFEVDKNYLEADENYLSFEVHFPERAREWKQLKSEAITLKGYFDIVAKGSIGNTATEYEDARRRISDDFFPLQKKYKDFAQRLSSDVGTISKYQIGTVFRYNKNCPICKKF